MNTFHIQRAQQPNNFDVLRLLLAVLVLYSHSYPLATGSEATEPIRQMTHGQMTGGAVAVDLFFVISGFLITASAERSRSLRNFFNRRVARIYPGFAVAALVDAVVVLPLSGGRLLPGPRWQQGADFVLQTLRLREFPCTGAFPANPYAGALNGSLWSIQFEFWCYVGIALLLLSGLLRRRSLLAVALAGSLVLSVLFQVRGWVFGGKWLGVLLGSPQLWARLLPLYLAGTVFYLWRDRIPFNALGVAAAVLLLVVASRMPSGFAALFPLAGTYLILSLAFSQAVQLHGFGRYGDFSYGAYLYAFPVEQCLMHSFGKPVAPATLFWCALPLTLAAAAASWYGVERRFLRAARRKRIPAARPSGQETAPSASASS